jgi:nucleotide-binding universal stress UspA family protein
VFRTVVVGIDGRPAGRDAIALARMLAPDDALMLTHVFPHDPSPSRVSLDGYEELLRRDAEKLLSDERDQAGVVRATIRAQPALSTPRGLRRAAARLAADLIAVGACERGSVGRVVAGADAVGTFLGAPCPVAIAPEGFARCGAAEGPVGVGYDGSTESKLALAAAGAVAHELGTRLEILAVVHDSAPVLSPYPSKSVSWAEIMQGRRAHAEKLVAHAAASAGAPAQGTVLTGLPAEALEGASHGLSLLVVGSRGCGPVRSVLLGSSARRLARHAGCPTARRPARCRHERRPRGGRGGSGRALTALARLERQRAVERDVVAGSQALDLVHPRDAALVRMVPSHRPGRRRRPRGC